MKRYILVSIILVFMAILAACSQSNAMDIGQGKKPAIEQAEASEKVKGSTQQKEPASADQTGGVIQDGKYTNAELGFSFDIPEHWKEHLVIESGYWEEDVDHSIDFYYVADGDVKQFLFSILVYDRVVEESEWQDEVWTYIGAHNGKTYGYVIAGEPTEVILEERNKKHFEFVQKLINEELLDVLGTFEYIDG